MKNYSVALVTMVFFTCTRSHGYEKWNAPDRRLRLDEVSFVGAHNALIAKEDKWVYAQQQWELTKQLDEGIRAFEIDIGSQPGKNKLFICHGSCKNIEDKLQRGLASYDTFISKMQELARWLKKNPQEIVVLTLDNMRDKDIKQNQFDRNIEMLSDDIRDLILTNADWNPMDHNGDWPTLQAMNDHLKQIVIFNPLKFGSTQDSPQYTYDMWKYVVGNRGSVSDPKAYTMMRGDSRRAYAPDQEEERKKYQRFFLLYHSNLASEDYALSGYKTAKQAEATTKEMGAKLGFKTDAATAREEANEISALKVSKSDYATIKKVVDDCKAAGLMNGKNPNWLMIDWTNRFIESNGISMVNGWNDEAASQIQGGDLKKNHPLKVRPKGINLRR